MDNDYVNEGPPLRGVQRLNRPFVRALLVSAAVAAAVALAGCNPEDVTPTGRSLAPCPTRCSSEIEAKQMDKGSPILARLFKEESELEIWKQEPGRPIRAAEDLSDLPLVGRSRPEDQGRRPPGARGLLHHHARADESEFQLLSRLQHRFSEHLRPRLGPHRLRADGAWRLLVARLLRHDRRADPGDLRAGARVVLRRTEGIPVPGLSVPHDRAEHGASTATIRTSRSGKRSRKATTTSKPPVRSRRSRSATSATCSTPRRLRMPREPLNSMRAANARPTGSTRRLPTP